MSTHRTHVDGSKLTVDGKSARIEINRVMGHCCWATLYVGRRKVHVTRDYPYGNTGAAFREAAERCDGGYHG